MRTMTIMRTKAQATRQPSSSSSWHNTTTMTRRDRKMPMFAMAQWWGAMMTVIGYLALSSSSSSLATTDAFTFQPLLPRHRCHQSVVSALHLLETNDKHNDDEGFSQGHDDDDGNKRKKMWNPGMPLAAFGLAFSLFAMPTLASDSSSLLVGQKYWTIMNQGEPEARVTANVALMDYAVGTINTMYYDHTGGSTFQPRDFFKTWRQWLEVEKETLSSRDGVEAGLRFLTRELKDPYSRYLTRFELDQERKGKAEGSGGFLRLGVMVEAPSDDQAFFRSSLGAPVLSEVPPALKASSPQLLSASKVQGLPVATAVSPNSPAERMGLTVGDRVVAVQQESFLEQDASEVLQRFQTHARRDKATEITIAKPVYAATARDDRDVIIAYRPQRLRLPTSLPKSAKEQQRDAPWVRSELLQGRQSSLFGTENAVPAKVGYVRLTGFSKAATTAFVEAIDQLEKQGAEDYIVDLRNNYGGVIQEAMLAAASLLRDPHAVLCFTLNAGGGFAPHDVTEYILHPRYPGYLMSTEPRTVSLEQVQTESPELFNGKGEWSPPSSYASLHEQMVKRGIRRPSTVVALNKDQQQKERLADKISKPKNLVILINEGTASSAEVFASALRDNGRTVALVGTKTFGKGLIQHTFPLPDGSALRLTIAEYLTPSLRHVTQVGAAQFDQQSGRWIGGGIKPDILCESRGIPSNIGGDYCLGVGLDALSEADSSLLMSKSSDSVTGYGDASVQNVSEEQTEKNDFDQAAF